MKQQEDAVYFTKDDIEQNRIVSGLAYIMFFLPIVAGYSSPYGRFHANQSLLLLITYFAGGIVLGFISGIGWILLSVYSLLYLSVSVIGVIAGIKGKAIELPFVGKYRLIKKPIKFLIDNFENTIENMTDNEYEMRA